MLARTRLSPAPRAPLGLRRLFAQLSVTDYLVFSYLVLLDVAMLCGEKNQYFVGNFLPINALFAFFLVGMTLTRGGVLKEGRAKALLYRLSIYAPVQLSYFFFRHLLPSVNPGTLDAELHALDTRVFGVEPAVLFDAIVTPFTTEWFSFFYFGYFVVLAVHVIPILFFSRNQRVLGEFTLGMLLIFCIGHSVYMLVPGFGPYVAMHDAFSTPFPRGIWLDMVMNAVNSGGALKDIFPSLHTAAPLFLALFSFRHRSRVPYRYTWPFVVFISLNIIGATMFLRWHYLIDVVAGIFLASFVMLIVPGCVDREIERRRAPGYDQLVPEG